MRGDETEPSLLSVQLSDSDRVTLERYKGAMSTDAFFSLLLRILETGAVSETPSAISHLTSAHNPTSTPGAETGEQRASLELMRR